MYARLQIDFTLFCAKKLVEFLDKTRADNTHTKLVSWKLLF